MNRRNAIKNLSIATGTIITLPAWMVSCGIADKQEHNTQFTTKQQQLIAAVADTIIPAGTAIGALTVETDKYIQKVLDDCYEQPVQENVKKQLDALNKKAEETYGKFFGECSQKERETLLLRFSDSTNKEEKEFFTLMKSETIRGFNTSQKVMEDYLGYKVAPGHYHGCVPV
jgi:hypothetical protein